jgi:threonine dehydrogenase-like Zn-dependent dehydrogenase
LSFDKAAMVEPLSVAWHAVRRSQIKPKDVAIVIGCGPVGLGVITMLKAAGVRQIVASDFSAVRRSLAERCGATMTIDAAKDSPYKNWKQFGHLVAVNDALVMASEAVDMLGKIPGLPWWHAWHLAEKLGATDPKRPIVFECVGAPGILQRILEGAPMYSRVVVAGVCMAQDAIQPSLAINKEIELRFVFGYTPVEFRDTLHMVAEGKVDPTALHTGTVGLEGVETAFDLLGKAERHAKILIDPASTAREPVAPAAA